MKLSLKFLTLVTVFTFVNLAVFAQRQGGGPGHQRDFDPVERAQKHTERMAKGLELNDVQQEKVLQINTFYEQETKQVFDANEDARNAVREQIKTIRDKRDAELKNVLTNEQYTLHLEKQEEKKERRKGKRDGNRSGGGNTEK